MVYMDPPAPDPKKLLNSWMEWERGESTPGRIMADLKTGGLRVLLEEIVASNPVPAAVGEEPAPSEEAWKPVV